MKKIIFPIDRQNYSTVFSMLDKCDYIVSTNRSSLLVNKDVGFINNSPFKDNKIIDIYDIDFKNISEFHYIKSSDTPVDQETLIYIFKELNSNNIKLFYDSSNEFVEWLNFDLPNAVDLNNDTFYEVTDNFYDIDKPIILFNNLVKSPEIYLSAYSLYKTMLDKGISVTLLSDDDNCSFIGGIKTPKSFKDSYKPFIFRSLELNAWMNRVVENTDSNIYIFVSNSGLTKLNNNYLNGFGESSQIINHAISVDYIVTNVPINQSKKDQLEYINSISEKLFNLPINIYYISAFEPNVSSTFQIDDNISYYHLKKENDFIQISSEDGMLVREDNNVHNSNTILKNIISVIGG